MGRLSISRLQYGFSIGTMFMVLLLLLPGCDNTDSVDPHATASAVAPTVSEYEIPPFWVFGSTISRDLTVQLSLSESVREAILAGNLEPPLVLAAVGENPTNAIYLEDDGGSVPLESAFDFVEDYSGDLIPNDFIYNVRINSTFATNEGEFRVVLLAGWFDPANVSIDSPNNTTTQVLDEMIVEINSPPVFESIEFPDSLHAGFEPEVWTLVVSDPDENADDVVTSVTMILKKDDLNIRERLFTDNGNHDWSLSADSTFAVALETGDYTVEFHAVDMFEQTTVLDTSLLWIENTPPLLFDVSVPDTVILPLEGANRYTFFASTSDQQGQGDIEKVYFTLRRPDGQYRDNNGLGFSFGDDGVPPDQVADDGNFVYDFLLIRDPETPPVLGTYTFYFYSKDRAGNITGPVTREIVEISETSETR